MSFKSDIERFTKKINADSEKVFRGTSIAMFSSIVKRTPVDKGSLVGNWQVDINNMPDNTLDEQDPGRSETITKGSTTANAAKINDAIFIVNNLPYAERIENGYSTVKSPEGMVRVTLTEFQREVEKQAKKVRR